MISFLLFSFLGTLSSVPLVQWIAQRYSLYDVAEQDELKIHKKPISYLGGLAILGGSMLGIFAIAQSNLVDAAQLVAVAIGFMVLFGFGFWDDVKWKHISKRKPYVKFLGLLLFPALAATILLFAGVGFRFFDIPLIIGTLTFLYIFVVVNAVNYQDGMDGLAAGLTVISAGAFFVVAMIQGNELAQALSLILLGASSAFLVFNFPPAKIFMGDSGAYFLGFFLVVLAVLFSKPFHVGSVIGPALIIGVPIADGLFTNMRRFFARKSIFLGDRKHLYDRLLQKGFSQRQTLGLVYLLQAVFVVLGVIISTKGL